MENITDINALCDDWFLNSTIHKAIAAKANKECKPKWAKQMEVAMKLIGDACKSPHGEAGCMDCPFDAFCDAILHDKQYQKARSMADIFCEED